MDTQKIYSALAKAKKDVDAIGKNRKNAAQGYNFRGIDDAMDAFAPLLADHGLTIVCDNITHLSSEGVTSNKGGTGWRVVNNYSFRIYAEDGSFIQGQADGEAIDYGDKCTTKAQSVALREFLFKTFMVPFHTVDDIEEASHEIAKTEAKPVTASKPVELPWMNDNQLADLLSIIEKGQYDGKNGQEVVKIARQKYAVNRDMAAKIDKAMSLRVGNNLPKKDLTKESCSIFNDPKAKSVAGPTKEEVDGVPF